MIKKRTKRRRKILIIILLLIVGVNVFAYVHAYKFTHFSDQPITRSADPKELSSVDKFKTLVFGVNNPRPANKKFPGQPYTTIRLKSNKEIECWMVNRDSAKGTVVIFHGFSGDKSAMIDKSDIFLEMGYNTMLVDFMGSGGSEGNQTTIGFFEAEQVRTCVEYLKNIGEENIFCFGTSMGSVAIMKAVNDYKLNLRGIMIECPFGSMYQTVCARFRLMHAPVFPMAGLLVFWGGVQNGFWAFGHNPTTYARGISCPTLLLFGERDDRVSRAEIDQIFNNLAGEKKLVLFPEAGHVNYLVKYQQEWESDVRNFLYN